MQQDIQHFRRFNRMYTHFLGTLNEGLLDSPFGLAEARVLYELATRPQPAAGEIAGDLGLDPAYLSRMLAKFRRGGLLRSRISASDRRRSELELTAKGRAAFRKLDASSEAQARSTLEGLGQRERRELIGSMAAIERVLGRTEAGAALVLRPHRVGDMGWVVHREAVGYADEFGWDSGFEALVAKIAGDFLSHFDAARERCWIAERGGQTLGHIFLVQHPEQADTAKLRLLFVEPCARGLGLGERLVRECLAFARQVGYRRVVLWTQRNLTAAHRIYVKAGFRLMKEEPHRSFGHNLVGQEWELELT